jgi:hypothetical protein
MERYQTLSEDEKREIQMQENFEISPGDAYEVVDEQDYRDYMKAKRASRQRNPRGKA